MMPLPLGTYEPVLNHGSNIRYLSRYLYRTKEEIERMPESAYRIVTDSVEINNVRNYYERLEGWGKDQAVKNLWLYDAATGRTILVMMPAL